MVVSLRLCAYIQVTNLFDCWESEVDQSGTLLASGAALARYFFTVAPFEQNGSLLSHDRFQLSLLKCFGPDRPKGAFRRQDHITVGRCSFLI